MCASERQGGYMLFVKTNKLKLGMRLAKPIYNRDGTLLYERDSKLTQQGIAAINNFGLIGIYILEPAEPVPPMTEDDIAFEKFQVVTVFAIQDELKGIIKNKKTENLQKIAGIILREYGTRDRRLNFVQNLRSEEDFVAKHSLNVAMLCAMMANNLKVEMPERQMLVEAALLHDIGKIDMPAELVGKECLMTKLESNAMAAYESKGFDIVEHLYESQPMMKRLLMQSSKMLHAFRFEGRRRADKLSLITRIMILAEVYDTMTAMNDYQKPTSEIAALKYLLENQDFFHMNIIEALLGSVNFLAEGCCIELSNGDEGLVLERNHRNVLKPRILLFKDNSIIELSDSKSSQGIVIKDAIKTLDNRYVIDKDTWNAYAKYLKESKAKRQEASKA